MGKQTVKYYIHTMEYYTVIKKTQLIHATSTLKKYVELKKPNTKEYMLLHFRISSCNRLIDVFGIRSTASEHSLHGNGNGAIFIQRDFLKDSV